MGDEGHGLSGETRREAWVMRLKPGNERIYKQKHNEIWPEMLAQMRENNVLSFSIYRHGLTLFAYLEHGASRERPKEPSALTRKWWEMMAGYMETNADNSPQREDLEEMFHFG